MHGDRHWPWSAAQPVVFHAIGTLGSNRRARRERRLRGTPRVHAPPFASAGRPARRTICLPDLPQGGQLVLPRTTTGACNSTTPDAVGNRRGIRSNRGAVTRVFAGADREGMAVPAA